MTDTPLHAECKMPKRSHNNFYNPYLSTDGNLELARRLLNEKDDRIRALEAALARANQPTGETG